MNFSELTKELIERAKENKKRIVLPETNDLRILKAADYISRNNIADVILIGSFSEIEFLCKANEIELDLNLVTIINPKLSDRREFYIESLYELRKNKGMSMVEAIEFMNDNVYFGIMMVKVGDADGMVAGATTYTAKILRPALQILKPKEGVETVSSFFIMDVPNMGDKNSRFIFGDCGLVVKPNSSQLADIAISSAESYRKLIKGDPKVAMLSFSTYGSGKSDEIDVIKEAMDKLKEKKAEFDFDGELQLDAALEEDVAKLKCPTSKVAGHANVLIFPSLDAGNIGYKLVKCLGKATAIGPLTQGMSKPFNDLSRGCNVEEIVGAVAVTALQSED